MDSSLYFSKFMVLMQSLRVGKTKVHLLPNHPGVDLPEHLRGDDIVRLDLSLRFKNADLKLFADEDIQITLSFSGVPYRCTLPWDAIISIEPPGNLMPTIAFPVEEEQIAKMGVTKPPSSEATVTTKPARPSFLRVVSQDEEAPPSA